MPDDKTKRRLQDTTIVDMGLPAILKEAKGDKDKALRIHAIPAYLLVEELKGCPPEFPPKLGYLIPDAAEIWKKLWMRLAMIFNAYEKKVEQAGKNLQALQTKYKTDTGNLDVLYKGLDTRLKAEETKRNAAERARAAATLRADAAETATQQIEGRLASKVQELTAAAAAKQQVNTALAAKSQELVDTYTAKQQVDTALAAKSQELVDTETAKQLVEGMLATRVRELAATITAKETAENHFSNLKPRFEKLGREYSELMTKFSNADAEARRVGAEATELGAENVELYIQIADFVNNVSGLTATLEVELKRTDDLEKTLKEAEKKLSKSQLRVRSGWYATAASLLIAVVGYVGWSISERPQIVQIVQQTTQPPVTTTQPPLIPQPKPETINYVMGAFLVELPDNQFVVTAKKDADLEKRAKSVSYLSGAYVVDFEDKQFALTTDKKSVVDQQMGAEKIKLGRDLTVVEKKAVYEKHAAKYVR